MGGFGTDPCRERTPAEPTGYGFWKALPKDIKVCFFFFSKKGDSSFVLRKRSKKTFMSSPVAPAGGIAEPLTG
jgi:hypothetical protein